MGLTALNEVHRENKCSYLHMTSIIYLDRKPNNRCHDNIPL